MNRYSSATCLEPNLLAAFAAGGLPSDAMRDVEAHLDQCDTCLLAVADTSARGVAAPMWLSTPETDDRFEIGALIAEGGMGRVYHGRDRATGQRVAIKCLRADFSAAEAQSLLQRFERECNVLRALDHPNIVRMLATRGMGARRDIVMEYVSGGSLRDLLRQRGPLPLARALSLTLELSDALTRAHHLGIIHRDIKPENILLAEDGTPRLADFGLARMGAQELTTPGVVLGTIAYQSPEGLRGESLDERTDIWSLGVVLFEMLTGQRPFAESHPAALITAILLQPPLDLAHALLGAPEPLSDLVARMLEKEPRKRLASMRQVGMELESLCKTSSSGAPLHSRAEQPRESLQGPRAGRRSGPRIVGREHELTRLAEQLRLAIQRSGRVVFVTGEAGAGKTLVSDEALRHAQLDEPEMILLTGRCFERLEPGEAYAPFLEAVDGLLAQHDQALEIFKHHAPTWLLQFPRYRASPGLAEYLERVTLGATRERMIRELGDALHVLTTRCPLLLRLEDLHWADPASIDLLAAICVQLHRQRLLLLVTFRSEELALKRNGLSTLYREAVTRDFTEQIALAPLSATDLEQYLERELHPNDFAQQLSRFLTRRTEGLPLFATRIVQHLVDRSMIVQTGEGWRLTRPIAELEPEVPPSVRALIGRKLERLSDADRELLHCASIEGNDFSSSVLTSALSRAPTEIEKTLRQLERGHELITLVGEERLTSGQLTLRYRFVHVLFQNELYAELIASHRRALHGRVAEALLEQYRDELGLISVRVATHLERAHSFARAIEHWLVAGHQATRTCAHRDARDYYSHALLLLERLPDAERPWLYCALHQKRAWASFHLTAFAEAAADFERVLSEARRLGDTALQGDALNALSHVSLHAHTAAEMEARAAEALRIGEANGHAGIALVAAAHLQCGRLWGEPGTEEALTTVLDNARAIRHEPALSLSLGLSGVVHFFRSRYDLASRMLSESISYDVELRESLFVATALQTVATCKGNLGLIDEALTGYRESLDLARRNEHAPRVLQSYGGLTWLYQELGDDDRAHECASAVSESGVLDDDAKGPLMRDTVSAFDHLLEAGFNCVMSIGNEHTRKATASAASALRVISSWEARVSWWHWLHRVRVEAYRAQDELARGELEAAECRACANLDLATRYGARKYIAIAQRQIAEAMARRGELAGAESRLRLALAAIDHCPVPIVAWKLHASLARLYRYMGRRDAERAAHAEASSLVSEIATHIADMPLRQGFVTRSTMTWAPEVDALAC